MTADQLRQYARRRGATCDSCTTHAQWLHEAEMVQHKRPMAIAGVAMEILGEEPTQAQQNTGMEQHQAAAEQTQEAAPAKDEL